MLLFLYKHRHAYNILIFLSSYSFCIYPKTTYYFEGKLVEIDYFLGTRSALDCSTTEVTLDVLRAKLENYKMR